MSAASVMARVMTLVIAAGIGQQAVSQQTPATPQAAANGIEIEKSFSQIASSPWTGKRRPDGQPDIEGHWSNTIANHNNFTDPQGGLLNDPSRRTSLGPRSERAPSRVSDPADGKIPYQDWARAKQQEFSVKFHNPTEPQFIEPLARCAPAGVPKSLYWHGYEIRQYPGYLLFLFDSGYRIIHLDGKPHLPESIKLWNADSRGHWEGNTLVVDVTNNNAKALFGRSGDFASENVHIVERYVFDNGNKRYNYVATVTDPTVYTRPWTLTLPARRWSEQDHYRGWHYGAVPANAPGKPPFNERYERMCVENNGGFGSVAAPQH